MFQLNLLPDDTLQYVLSFAGIYHVKGVNKKWKQLADQNERFYLTQLYGKIQTKITNSPIEYNANHNYTWIIHQNRKELTKVETDLGFKGPFADIQETIEKCKPGDVIIIHDGLYCDDFVHGMVIEQDITLIGAGTEVIISDQTPGESFCTMGTFSWNQAPNIQCSVYMENIKFDCRQSDCTEGVFYLAENCKLWLNNCKFNFTISSGISVRNGAYLEVRNCKSRGGTNFVAISPAAKEVHIINNVFKFCGMESQFSYAGEAACISVTPEFSYRNTGQFVLLKCTANIFENNLGYTIAERHVPYGENNEALPHSNDEFIINTDHVILKDNVLRGKNGVEVRNNDEIHDANKMYYNTQPSKFSDCCG